MKNNWLLSTGFILIFGLASLLLQTTWLPKYSVWGTFPNLILILICLTGAFKGPTWGSVTGSALGFLMGLLNRHLFLTFFLWLIMGTLFGLLKSDLFNNLKALAGVSCLLGTWLAYFFYWLVTAIFLKEVFFTPLETILLTSLLNGALAYLLFPIFKLGFSINE